MYTNIQYFSNRIGSGFFSASDFSSLIRPSIFVCQIYGLISCKIVNGKIEQSKFIRLYCTAVTLTYICSSILTLYIINVSSYINRLTTWMLQDNCFYILANFIVITNYVFAKPTVGILQNLAKVTKKLPIEKFKKIGKWIHLKDLILYILLSVHLPKLFSGNVFVIFSKTIGAYATNSIYLLDFQYINYAAIIGGCFQHINEELVKLKHKATKGNTHLLRRIFHDQFNPLLYTNLRYLKQWHYELNEMIKKINSTFGLHVVASMILTFTELTFTLYFYILDKRVKNARESDKDFFYCFYYTMVSYFSSKLLLFTLTCQFVNEENMKTREIVNEIIINTDDRHFKEELHTFSLQLLHINNSFVAKGVQLDCTLLTAMAGGIFTYLLVLIQFLVTNQ